MKAITPKILRLIITGLQSWITSKVNNAVAEAIANRPPVYTLSQDEYDNLGESLDPAAVYLIKEDTAAAASLLSDEPEA